MLTRACEMWDVGCGDVWREQSPPCMAGYSAVAPAAPMLRLKLKSVCPLLHDAKFHAACCGEKLFTQQNLFTETGLTHSRKTVAITSRSIHVRVCVLTVNSFTYVSAEANFSLRALDTFVIFFPGQVNETEEAGSMRAYLAMVWTRVETTQPLVIQATPEEQTWYYITSIATNLDTKFNPLSEALYQWDEAIL